MHSQQNSYTLIFILYVNNYVYRVSLQWLIQVQVNLIVYSQGANHES